MNFKKYWVIMVLLVGGWGLLELMPQETGNGKPLTGRIVYILGQTVREYDFQSGERTILYEHPGFLGDITEVNRNSFIISDLDRKMFLVTNGQAKILGDGRLPVFFPAYKKLLYGKSQRKIQGGGWDYHLYQATLKNGRLISAHLVSDSISPYPPMLAISESELLVGLASKLYLKYDLRSDSSTSFPIEGCVAAKTWWSPTREVVCWNGKGYFLTNLNDHGRRRPIPIQGIEPLFRSIALPVPLGNCFLVSKVRWSWRAGGEVRDLYAYDFSTGAGRRIAKTLSVPSHTNGIYWSATNRDVE